MEPTVIASAKYLRIPARKVRFVAALLRGRPVNVAMAELALNPRRPSPELLKLLRSAVANATSQKTFDVEALVIKEIRVDQGPKTHRWTPRARGGAAVIEKKTSHVTLVLEVGKTKPKSPRYDFVAKSKKAKESEKAKKSKRALKGQVEDTESTEAEAKARREKPEPGAKIEHPEKPKGGFLKRSFHRKSI